MTGFMGKNKHKICQCKSDDDDDDDDNNNNNNNNKQEDIPV